MTRAAMTFAMEKLGQNYLNRLLDFVGSSRLAPQVQGLSPRELGPSIVPALMAQAARSPTPTCPRAGRPEAPRRARRRLDPVAVLDPLTKDREQSRGHPRAAQKPSMDQDESEIIDD